MQPSCVGCPPLVDGAKCVSTVIRAVRILDVHLPVWNIGLEEPFFFLE
jgi:hypothetical protein